MKKVILSALLLLCVTCFVSKPAVSASVSWSEAISNVVSKWVNDAVNGAKDSFIRSISDYFVAPLPEVMAVRKFRIPDDEIPVVFYLARQANVTPATIMQMRLEGKTWLEIANRYGYGPEIFYVPVNANAVIGPPYGHAYGYYRNKPKKDWNKIMLRDDDIVNLVYLRFISEHYHYSPETIMKTRQKSKWFYANSADAEIQWKANVKNAKAASVKKAKAAPADVKKAKAAKQPKADKKAKAVKKPNAAKKPKAAVKKQKKGESKPEHKTGTKKQAGKAKK